MLELTDASIVGDCNFIICRFLKLSEIKNLKSGFAETDIFYILRVFDFAYNFDLSVQ